MIPELIKKKRRLRRQKSSALAAGDLVLVQNMQREMNVIGREIKKEQKKEERRRHEVECQKLSREKNPRKFFQSVRSLTCSDDGARTSYQNYKR